MRPTLAPAGASRATGVPDWTLSLGCQAKLHLATQHTQSLVLELPRTFATIQQSYNFGMGTSAVQSNQLYQNPLMMAQASKANGSSASGFIRAGVQDTGEGFGE